MYFVLPIEGDRFGARRREANIDWQLIRYCATGARVFKSHFTSEKGISVLDDYEVLMMRNLLQYGVDKEDAIFLATGFHTASELIDNAVVAVHTGRIYSVVKVIRDKTSKSPFPDPKEDQYSNYCDYFEKK